MRDTHTIRLRGPWQLEPVARWVETAAGPFEWRADDLPPPTRAKQPADWSQPLGAGFRGQVRYVRRFQQPTGLEDLEQVWLVVEPVRSFAEVSLNGHALGKVGSSGPPGRWHVTEWLRSSNQLEVTVMHPAVDAAGQPTSDSDLAATGGLIGGVRLEIGFP